MDLEAEKEELGSGREGYVDKLSDWSREQIGFSFIKKRSDPAPSNNSK
jgi:hypothetical protein